MVLPSFPPWEDRTTYLNSAGILHAELIFGVTSKRCSGNGICSLYTKGSIHLEKFYCHYATVTIECDYLENLRFTIDRKSMRKSTILKYFNNAFFLQEEDFVIPKFIKEQLPISRSVIARGDYLMYEFGEYYHIFFPYE